ncbi:MAG: hypothetical protein HXY53_00745 [Nitrospirae bacterium]|nr:hypothetical protein [Nitrospirota bacterium]
MRIIKKFLVISMMPMLFLINCTGKESSEEKIKITIEHGDKGVKEVQKAPEKLREEVPVPPKKPEAPPKTPIASKPPIEFTPKPQLQMGMDFKTVANNLSLDYHSKYEIKDYWQKVEGKPVIWGGRVYEVDKGRRGFKILVDNPGLKSRKGFNIVLIGDDKQNIESISSGDHIRFKGILRKFDYGQSGYSPLIVLSDAKIL